MQKLVEFRKSRTVHIVRPQKPAKPHQKAKKKKVAELPDMRKVENEYRLMVEAEMAAKFEAKGLANEWYRLAEIEAKTKIATKDKLTFGINKLTSAST